MLLSRRELLAVAGLAALPLRPRKPKPTPTPTSPPAPARARLNAMPGRMQPGAILWGAV